MHIPHSKPTIIRKDIKAVEQVLASGKLAQAEQVKSFEKELCRFLGRKEGIAVSSGTAALHLALLALNIDEQSEVMLPSYTCLALLHALSYVGAKPVLLDTDPETLLLDPDEIRKKRTSRTKALIVVHPFGFIQDVSFYSMPGVPVIEDIATSIGAKIKKIKAGEAGKLAIGSFYATKMLTTGEGGMVLTDNKKWSNRIRQYRSYDEKSEFEIAFNYKMTDFQAALGRSQLKQLPQFLKKRRSIAEKLNKFFQNCPEVLLPIRLPHSQPAYHRYIFRSKNSVRLFRFLNQKGIQARKPVYKPLHQYLNQKGFPGTELLMKEIVSLPIFPNMTSKEFNFMFHQIKDFFK